MWSKGGQRHPNGAKWRPKGLQKTPKASQKTSQRPPKAPQKTPLKRSGNPGTRDPNFLSISWILMPLCSRLLGFDVEKLSGTLRPGGIRHPPLAHFVRSLKDFSPRSNDVTQRPPPEGRFPSSGTLPSSLRSSSSLREATK